MPESPSTESNSGRQNSPSKFERLVETTNKLFQIAAIMAAGIWALWTWNQLTAPSLKTGLTVSADTGRSRWDPSSNACVNSITVTIENLGQRNIEVSRVDYQVSKAKLTHLDSADIAKVEEGPPKEAEPVKQGHLEFMAGRYAPKLKNYWTFAVFASPNPDEELWFQAKAFDRNNNLLDFGYTSWRPCQNGTQ